jgi:hypothetical protein
MGTNRYVTFSCFRSVYMTYTVIAMGNNRYVTFSCFRVVYMTYTVISMGNNRFLWETIRVNESVKIRSRANFGGEVY